jgi:hypothetical protein
LARGSSETAGLRRVSRLRNAAATDEPRVRKDLDVDPRFARPPPDLRVLVTCGAGGIGAVIARAFMKPARACKSATSTAQRSTA